MGDQEYKRIRVLVETDERALRGYIYKPMNNDSQRLSDYLNAYEDKFLRMSDVEILDRGHQYKVGDKQAFVAISISAIAYITPLEGE